MELAELIKVRQPQVRHRDGGRSPVRLSDFIDLMARLAASGAFHILCPIETQERNENPQHEPAKNRDDPIPKRPQGIAGASGSGHACQCRYRRVEITQATRARRGTAPIF